MPRGQTDRCAPHVTTVLRMVAVAAVLGPGTIVAQVPKDNIYRYVLDVDIPEAAALVALDAAESTVLRGSAPKPVMGTLSHGAAEAGGGRTAAAVDVVPYWFFGGGARTLPSYRANSIAGRLLRVVTKTTLSLALVDDGDDLLGAVALRTTFHDPHDPVLNSRLPERVDSVLRAAGVREDDATVEDMGDRGASLARVFSDARRAMRSRGDIQISAGWGMAGRLSGGSIVGDSIQDVRHTLWITGQHSTGERLDILVTAQYRDVFDQAQLRIGAGLQRKARRADFRVELYYDWASRRFHPGVSADVHVVRGVSAVAALTSGAPPSGGRGVSQARGHIGVRWYAASGG